MDPAIIITIKGKNLTIQPVSLMHTKTTPERTPSPIQGLHYTNMAVCHTPYDYQEYTVFVLIA